MKKEFLPKEPPFLRTENNYDIKAASDATALHCPEPTLTQQSFAEESDINYIAERFGLTGELPTVKHLPSSGDFTGVYDFQTALNAVVKAQNDFLELPAKIRDRFNNDPQKLLDFLADPANREEAEFLKLIDKRPEKAPESPKGDAAPGPTPDKGAPNSDRQTAPDAPTKGKKD